MGLCDLRKALLSTRPVRRKGRRWAGRSTLNDGRGRVLTSVLFTRGMLGNVCSCEVLSCLICFVCARACGEKLLTTRL